jgi:hypothetical protein
MERTIQVRHISLEVNTDCENFTQNLEKLLGRLDPSLVTDLKAPR